MGFLKESEISTGWNFESTGCLTLSDFLKWFGEALPFAFAVKQKSIGYFNKSTDCFLKTLIEFC